MWPAVAAFAFFYPANLGIVPFDIPEAETEVLEGPLLEYSGPALGLFKVMSALKAVVVLGLGVALFLPLPLTGVAALAGWAAKLLVLMLIGVTVVRVSRAACASTRPSASSSSGRCCSHRVPRRRRLFPREVYYDRPRKAERHRRALALDLPHQRRLLQRLRRRAATTALIPRYDVERLGCQYCGSPRHADIVLITGPLTTRVHEAVLRIFAEIPDPKVTVAVGVCPISGGIFRESYAVARPSTSTCRSM